LSWRGARKFDASRKTAHACETQRLFRPQQRAASARIRGEPQARFPRPFREPAALYGKLRAWSAVAAGLAATLAAPEKLVRRSTARDGAHFAEAGRGSTPQPRNQRRRHDTNDHDSDPRGRRFTPFAHRLKPKNADKDSLEISLRMADWLALHARRQTHDR
jgi:hypothetical protein